MHPAEVKYGPFDHIHKSPFKDSKADFFKRVTVFSWVMVILVALTSVLSFDKLFSRSSPWTLTVGHE